MVDKQEGHRNEAQSRDCSTRAGLTGEIFITSPKPVKTLVQIYNLYITKAEKPLLSDFSCYFHPSHLPVLPKELRDQHHLKVRYGCPPNQPDLIQDHYRHTQIHV